MSKHTPGPWHCSYGQWGDHSEDLGGGMTIYMGEASRGKATIRTSHHILYGEDIYEGDSEFEEIRANANLIAAAPEMLEALERAVEFLPDPSTRGVKTIPAPTQVAIDARAAIAKAKGASDE